GGGSGVRQRRDQATRTSRRLAGAGKTDLATLRRSVGGYPRFGEASLTGPHQSHQETERGGVDSARGFPRGDLPPNPGPEFPNHSIFVPLGGQGQKVSHLLRLQKGKQGADRYLGVLAVGA